MVGSSPKQHWIERSRWELALIRQAFPELRSYSLSGAWRLLYRHGVRYKRGRQYIHSPDEEYAEKLSSVRVVYRRCYLGEEEGVLLFGDELTYYRQPSVSMEYAFAGRSQPLVRLGYTTNVARRIVGVLDGLSGRVLYREGRRIGSNELVSFYEQVCKAFGCGKRIYLVEDNWPVHFHWEVLEALEPQRYLKSVKVPGNWRKGKFGSEEGLCLPIQLLPLPTYAPWTNPIEKVWRRLRQEVLHHHQYEDRIWDLRDAVCTFLDQFSEGSEELLRYVGLESRSGIYSSVFVQEMVPP
ncbi:MAG: IS630 family transposase [candidate division KSB1 bacterium]|nr:IS630 family transposase [candidate division KSB1 bacterium]